LIGSFFLNHKFCGVLDPKNWENLENLDPKSENSTLFFFWGGGAFGGFGMFYPSTTLSSL
jgi:hypothetical protein